MRLRNPRAPGLGLQPPFYSGLLRVRAALFWAVCAWGFGAGAGFAGAVVPQALPGAPEFPTEVRAALESALANKTGREVRTRHRDPAGVPIYSNRLILEASPYLQQHAHNPVNWWPWGEQAFAEAKRLKRPVFVSIGYSTCHWCHVMEEESFDDVDTARVLNEKFIAIKVDREVRPDVDAIYMQAAYAITGGGGWPLNVFLTPEAQAFYAGTYFPPRDTQGRPSFQRVLAAIDQQWKSSPERIQSTAKRMTAAIRQVLEVRPQASHPLTDAPLLGLAEQSLSRLDRVWGGLRAERKFPSSFPARALLRIHRRGGDSALLDAVDLTLRKIAAGGIRDHLGGGFHRYSVDPEWRVPHFEKMLYDNAQLAALFAEAWQATDRPDFRRVAMETLDYLGREMSAPDGGFYSATDADSPSSDGESIEGWFFTWTPQELAAVLGPKLTPQAVAVWGVTPTGQLEGRSVLRRQRSLADVASSLSLARPALEVQLESARRLLYEARGLRAPPLRDEKVIVAWNGLTISALARAGFAFNEPRYLRRAERCAAFLLRVMKAPGESGRLRRIFVDGRTEGPAFLNDYAFFIAGLLDLYGATFDVAWLEAARELQALQDQYYWSAESFLYRRGASDGPPLLAKETPTSDGVVPSGNSVALMNLLRLADLTTVADYDQRARQLLTALTPLLADNPLAYADLQVALDYLLDAAKEIVVVVPPTASKEELHEMLEPLREEFIPNRVLSVIREGEQHARHVDLVPAARSKPALEGKVTAYVCRDQVCRFPTTDPHRLATQLADFIPLSPVVSSRPGADPSPQP